MEPATNVTGEEIILELLNNLEQSLEPLRYTVLAPSVFDIFLHPDDMDHLAGIFPQIVEEARRALDEQLETLRRDAAPSKLRKWLSGQARESKEFRPVAGGWYISFHENADADAAPGEILIESRLTLPPTQDLGSGSRTRRISTLRSGGTSRLLSTTVEDISPGAPTGVLPASSPAPPRDSRLEEARPDAWPPAQKLASVPTSASLASVSRPPEDAEDVSTDKLEPPRAGTRHARLTYRDDSGVHSYTMTRPEIVVGRGGTGYWVDVKLETLPDVSRTHLKIRRDEDGRFFIKDVSAFGTSVDGVRLPSSIDVQGDRKLDRNREVLLPSRAKIGLADVLFVEFEVLEP